VIDGGESHRGVEGLVASARRLSSPSRVPLSVFCPGP
jgi:hypothetical protein